MLEGCSASTTCWASPPSRVNYPRSQQRKAIRIGLFLAYLFRVLALLVAGWLATNTWVRWLGSAYLIWLMSSHLTKGTPMAPRPRRWPEGDR